LVNSQSYIFTDIDVVVLIWLKSSNGAKVILPFELEVHEPTHDLFGIPGKKNLMSGHGSNLSDLRQQRCVQVVQARLKNDVPLSFCQLSDTQNDDGGHSDDGDDDD
jgi:hypothetical protein